MVVQFDSFTWQYRKHGNEDSIVTGVDGGRHYFGVADGVSGSPGGSIASKLAIAQAEITIKNSSAEMGEIFASVQKKIAEEAENNPNLQDMATTLTLCVIQNNSAFVGHVGDSRLYVLRKKEIVYKTLDQTLLQQLLDGGAPVSSLQKKQYSTILTSVLSRHNKYRLDTACINILPNDLIIMCSDGVYRTLSEVELLELWGKCNDFQSFFLKVKAVLRIRGIEDDSSLICIKIS